MTTHDQATVLQRTERFRIAMVGACPYPMPQGSQVLLRNTAVALRDRGHAVHLVVCAHGAGSDPDGLEIHRSRRIPGMRKSAAGPSFAKPVLDFGLVRTLRRVVREQRIDVVHAHNYEGLEVALKAGKRPIVYHAHHAMADVLSHSRPLGRLMGKRLDRRYPRQADRVIVPHERLREYLVTCGCDASRITVIPPPVDVTEFDLRAASPEESLDMPPVVYTGSLDKYQNLGLLERTMAMLAQHMPNVRLIVATSEPGQVAGAQMAATPDLDALRRVLARDVVVACPRVSWSGYPLKVLNAMAAGRPVVACESAAHAITNRHDGAVVPDNDEKTFAQALHWLLTNPKVRARLGGNARNTVAVNHAPSKIAAAIEQVYRGAMGSVTKGPRSG